MLHFLQRTLCYFPFFIVWERVTNRRGGAESTLTLAESRTVDLPWPMYLYHELLSNLKWRTQSRGRIFSYVRPFYERAVSHLNRSMHLSLGLGHSQLLGYLLLTFTLTVSPILYHFNSLRASGSGWSWTFNLRVVRWVFYLCANAVLANSPLIITICRNKH